MRPLITALAVVPNALSRGGVTQTVTEAELRMLIDIGAEEKTIGEDEAELLDRVFHFHDRRVNEIMVPRTDVVWLEQDATLAEFYAEFRETPRTRFPVYDDTIDNVVGIVNIKDVLRGIADGSLHETDRIDLAMRSPLFVPETKFVGACFFQMQQAGQQMAIIVDEYGGTAGIVTLEMLLEELVGYVSDELRRHEEEFVEVAKNTFQVDAGMTIHDANEELDLDLPEDEDYETIAGFVLAELGHIPAEGEQFTRDGVKVTVTKVEGNRIEEVTITRE
jgi:CBS domain containing-hemolysin-like protein